jgi:predicted nucleotidyltransferase
MFGLTEEELNGIKQILSKYPEVREAKIFGSRARGDYKPASDIDMTIIGCDITHQQLALIDFELEELALPVFIDLNHYSSLRDKCFIEQIDKEGISFYKA